MIADFVQRILPSNTTSNRTTVDFSDKRTTPLKQTHTPSPPRPRSVHPDSHEIMYETLSSPQERGVLEDEEEEEVGNADNDYVQTDAREFGNKYFREKASPYVMSYLYDSTSLDKDFGIRKDDGDFRICR